MSRLTKIQKLEKEVQSIFGKASEELNLMIAIKTERELIKKFKNRLTGLKK